MNPLDYFKLSNVHSSPKATIVGVVIAGIATASHFLNGLGWTETLIAYAVATAFIFAGPKKKEDEKPS